MIDIKEFYKWYGTVEIIKSNGSYRKIKNLITNNALDEIIKSLYYPSPNIELKYIAIGDDDTPTAATDTTLGNEIYRFPILTKLRAGIGEVQSRGVLSSNQPSDYAGIVTIKEIGFFCGSHAYNWMEGAGKDTGLLLSRIVLSPTESKTDTEEIQITRTDEFVRG
jgi:hypothetical protein